MAWHKLIRPTRARARATWTWTWGNTNNPLALSSSFPGLPLGLNHHHQPSQFTTHTRFFRFAFASTFPTFPTSSYHSTTSSSSLFRSSRFSTSTSTSEQPNKDKGKTPRVLTLEGLLEEIQGGGGGGGNTKEKDALVDLSSLLDDKTRATLLPEGLPKGLKLELASGPHILCRHEMRSFIENILAPEGEKDEGEKKHLVDGSKGTGKSVLLTLLVVLARMKGWIVVYLPSCSKLTSGGCYKYDETSNLWDNYDRAGETLAHMRQAHKNQIDELLLEKNEGSASAGDTQGDDRKEEDSVQVLVDTLTALASQDKRPLLICMDDYNALFGSTGYFDYSGEPLSPHDLRLVCSFRWLERPEIVRGSVVASSTTSLPIRKTVKIAQSGDVQDTILSPFSYEEACLTWAKYGQEQPNKRSKEEQILKNFVLAVSGNGHAIRDYSAFL